MAADPNLSPPRQSPGYTLVEVIIAMGVVGVLMMSIVALSMFTARSFEVLGDFSALDRGNRFAMDTLGKDIRRAARVESCTSNRLVLSYLDPDRPPVTNNWDPATRIVTRDSQGISRNLLTECDSLVFQMYTRNISNEFTFRPTADPAQAKLIWVTWRCSHQIYGQNTNIETYQSAKFVIRN